MYIDERHFVKTAIQKMDFLELLWSKSEYTDPVGLADQTDSALAAIKTTALSVQARGVYRAAALCEDVKSRLAADNVVRMTSALVELKRLINLYADGLFEIDPEFAELLHQPEESPNMDAGLASAHAKAVQTLSPLLHKVQNSKLRGALRSMMQHTAIELPEKMDRKSMSLDALIQPISNLVLSEARHCGKTVSVSYAADFDEIGFETAETMQEVLETVCLTIVSQGIPGPSKITLGSTPQISLTGQIRGGNILFSISWMGNEIEIAGNSDSGIGERLAKLEQRGGSYSMNNLALSDKLKSRHTLYISLPIVDKSGVSPIGAQAINTLKRGANSHA